MGHSTFTFTYPLTVRAVGAPQMTSQPVSSLFLCSPLQHGTWQTLGLSIPWCCLPTSSFCLSGLLPPFTVPWKARAHSTGTTKTTTEGQAQGRQQLLVPSTGCEFIIPMIVEWTFSLETKLKEMQVACKCKNKTISNHKKEWFIHNSLHNFDKFKLHDIMMCTNCEILLKIGLNSI